MLAETQGIFWPTPDLKEGASDTGFSAEGTTISAPNTSPQQGTVQ